MRTLTSQDTKESKNEKEGSADDSQSLPRRVPERYTVLERWTPELGQLANIQIRGLPRESPPKLGYFVRHVP